MSVGEILKAIFDAVLASNWKIVAAAVIIGVIQLVKTYGKKVPILASGKVAFMLAIVMGMAGAIANAVMAHVPLGGFEGVTSLLINGASTGLIAAGGYSGVKAIAAKKTLAKMD